jgi:hypothetical protein
MPRSVQIRNVPEAIHRKLKLRAVEEGLSLSDYLGREVKRLAALPTVAELNARFAKHPHSEEVGRAAVEAIRAGRSS